MGTKLEFKRGDGSIVVVVGLVFAAAAWTARLGTRAERPDPDNWWTPLVFLGVCLVVTAALVAIQRTRPPNSVFTAALPGLILALIPLVVSFVLGDLTTTEPVVRHLANVVAISAASVLIYIWSRRRAGGVASTGQPGVNTI